MSELDRDPRLLAALRHAPDADVQAPAALRDAILGRAREAVAAAPRASVWQRWQAAWSAPARWGASGAFATVVMAGAITLLWRDDTPGPASETRAEAPVTVPVPASSPPAPAAVAERKLEPPRRAAQKAAAPPAPQAPTTPAVADAQSPTAPAVADAQATARERPLGGAAPARAPARMQGQGGADNAVGAALEAPAAAPAPSPAPAAALRAPRLAQRAQERISPPPWGAPPQPDDDVQWQPPQPGEPPAASWLQQLADRTAGAWLPAPGASPPPGTAIVRWQRGGQAFGRLWIETRAGTRWLLWCSDNGCQQAPLKEETPR